MELIACFVSASRQNVFFAELLEAFADALAGHGIAVETAVDHFPAMREGLVYVFVPHELLPLIAPEAHPSEPQLQRSVTICTEQPGTNWFAEDARIAKRAGAVVDINRLGLAALEKDGVRARFLQLGYIEQWDRWGGARDSERAVDLVFLGGVTPRRLTALARCGPHLVGRRTQLHLAESVLPHRAGSATFIAGARKWDLLSDSKILINIHRSELGYLEWQRAAEAITNGSVLLSEHSLGFEPLVPGEHFVSVSFNSLEVALEALLDDQEMLARMRASAYEFLRNEYPLTGTIEVLADAIDEASKNPVANRASRRESRPQPLPPAPPPAAYELILKERTDLDIVRMTTKQLLLDQRELRRTLADLERTLGGAAKRHDTIEFFGPRSDEPPRVSVIVTVYNYASLVGRAIDSVAVSEFEDYELVIVDDCSTDGSHEAIVAALARAPWVSATVLTRAENRGLARARNLGAKRARGNLVFMLDADNAIYPHALGRLVEALDRAPDASFAYGIIEQFGVDGPTSLMSFLEWDPDRLRYGNFVDAMSMIRRAALLEAGGYLSDSRLYGWEDFALWCTFADHGLHGVRVPEIIARYRLALHSMISLTNIDASAVWSHLVDRFDCLTA